MCKRSDWCSVSSDGAVVICMRIRSDKQTRNGGWLHRLEEGAVVAPFPSASHSARPQRAAERATIEHCHTVYASLLSHYLELAAHHRRALLERGLTPESIKQNGYASAPHPTRAAEVARLLATEFDLSSVPGFYLEDGHFRLSNLGSGFYVPVRDLEGRIRGLQLRRDRGLPKYLWLSSSGRPAGASSGSPVHFCLVNHIHRSGHAIITEGALKADVISQFLDCGVIALAGVNAFNETFASRLKCTLPELRQLTIAFDRDWREKPQVFSALTRLMRSFVSVRIPTKIWSWPAPAKGLDDHLLMLSKERERVAL